MDAILNWYREEGTIFKGGSGAGINLSSIRSSKEHLKGGGTASGPVSFMRGADASAGTIKSGGKTRRAAKMVILNADHPDVEEFVWCKAIEERKARALRDAGFDMDLDGSDSHSIQYQNANNSVRVTDDVHAGGRRRPRLGAARRSTTATHGQDAEGARPHASDRAVARGSAPTPACSSTRRSTSGTPRRTPAASTRPTRASRATRSCTPTRAWSASTALLDRARRGETFGVYTHDATNPDAPAERLEITRPEAIMVTGWNEIVKLRFSNGMELRCTPSHRIFTTNRGYVEAKDLADDDEVKMLTLPAPATHADWKLPVDAKLYALAGRGDKKSRTFALPEKWTPELAHYLGWLVGDGCISGDVISTVYGSDEEQRRRAAHAPRTRDGDERRRRADAVGAGERHGAAAAEPSRAIARFFEALGVSRKKAAEKVVPRAVYEAPPEIVAAFLAVCSTPTAASTTVRTRATSASASSSRELLVGVQRLLSTFGVFSRIYETPSAAVARLRVHAQGRQRRSTYAVAARCIDLRISNRSIARFAEHVGLRRWRRSKRSSSTCSRRIV